MCGSNRRGAHSKPATRWHDSGGVSFAPHSAGAREASPLLVGTRAQETPGSTAATALTVNDDSDASDHDGRENGAGGKGAPTGQVSSARPAGRPPSGHVWDHVQGRYTRGVPQSLTKEARTQHSDLSGSGSTERPSRREDDPDAKDAVKSARRVQKQEAKRLKEAEMRRTKRLAAMERGRC